MARSATNWRAFSRDVLRSLPTGTGYAEHQRALRAAGKLWTQERTQRNPELLNTEDAGHILLLLGVFGVAIWLMGRR